MKLVILTNTDYTLSVNKRACLVTQLKSATHQKTPQHNMKRSEDNTDDRERQGQRTRQA